MKALIQRVDKAEVTVDSKIISSIGKGILVFLGIEKGDTEKDIDYLVKKISQLRIFEDEKGKINLSLQDVKGEILVVSQFTLCADCRRGNRPSFDMAERPEIAKSLYEQVVAKIKESGISVSKGIFGASMKISLINNGPVTIMLESKEQKKA